MKKPDIISCGTTMIIGGVGTAGAYELIRMISPTPELLLISCCNGLVGAFLFYLISSNARWMSRHKNKKN